MGTTTKQHRKAAETVKIPEASERLGMSRSVLYRMVELGYFTDRRQSPLSDLSNRLIFTDEIERYLELSEEGLPRERVLAGMRQFRKEAGRLK